MNSAASALVHTSSTVTKDHGINHVLNRTSLSGGTVTRISQDWDEVPDWGKRKRDRKAPKNGTVTTMRAQPNIWAAAKALVGGDWRRLEVISPTEVFIHNHPWR